MRGDGAGFSEASFLQIQSGRADDVGVLMATETFRFVFRLSSFINLALDERRPVNTFGL